MFDCSPSPRQGGLVVSGDAGAKDKNRIGGRLAVPRDADRKERTKVLLERAQELAFPAISPRHGCRESRPCCALKASKGSPPDSADDHFLVVLGTGTNIFVLRSIR